MKVFATWALVAAFMSQAAAEPGRIKITTDQRQYTRWTVYEVSDGNIVPGNPVFIGPSPWGDTPGITIPFTNCDGYWYAQTTFRVPRKATNVAFNISQISADDRIVIQLNGHSITGAGTDDYGHGAMQFTDPGKNQRHDFQFESGAIEFFDTRHIRRGLNVVTVIVNNTNQGIFGTIQQVNSGSPSNFGLNATVTYTPP